MSPKYHIRMTLTPLFRTYGYTLRSSQVPGRAVESVAHGHDHEHVPANPHDTRSALPVGRRACLCPGRQAKRAAKPAPDHIALIVRGHVQRRLGLKVKTKMVKEEIKHH
jgi:hypothetical protein